MFVYVVCGICQSSENSPSLSLTYYGLPTLPAHDFKQDFFLAMECTFFNYFILGRFLKQQSFRKLPVAMCPGGKMRVNSLDYVTVVPSISPSVKPP